MYTFESRVRFSEADHTELLTLPGLVNYFQDCSTFQSEDIGYGVESLKKSGQAWICLLYTSPSPRDRSVSRMPSSA